jgi:hypothetical protein
MSNFDKTVRRETRSGMPKAGFIVEGVVSYYFLKMKQKMGDDVNTVMNVNLIG